MNTTSLDAMLNFCDFVFARIPGHLAKYIMTVLLYLVIIIFQILDQVSLNPSDAKCVEAKKNPKKNRSSDFLPGNCMSSFKFSSKREFNKYGCKKYSNRTKYELSLQLIDGVWF